MRPMCARSLSHLVASPFQRAFLRGQMRQDTCLLPAGEAAEDTELVAFWIL